MKEDWVECKLGELFNITYGKQLPIKKLKENGYPVFGANGIIGNYSDYKYEHKQVLISCRGAASGTINMSPPKCFVTNNSLIIETDESRNIYKKFLLFMLMGANRSKIISGTAQPQVTINNANTLKLNVTSLPIQRAIVAKIEELFSSLDSGIADLTKAQKQLVVYRQAVLKKAFEGELTKEWREKQFNLPTAEELLEQIKEERERYYEQQLEDWKKAVEVWEENGKLKRKPSKPRALKTVEEFTRNEILEFDTLPYIWKWIKLGNIFQVFIGSTPSRNKSEYWQNGSISWVSSGEVAFKAIFQTKEKITIKGLENTSTTVHPIGTVMLAMIGEGKTRGQAAILEIEACHNQNTAAIRVSEVGYEPKFLFHYLFFKYEKNRRVGSGNNQKALNQGRIMDFDYPLCSPQEQHQIVREIESRLSVCDKVEENIAESLEKAKALRQSILKKAFEGKLLSEEEIAKCKREKDYEPAYKLLERIRGEKKQKK